MTEAKVPDEKSDWKSIDIFLFSNGQESCPPRKYHLETNQLDWWKVTLNNLAKAQYGSMHSVIDLYTIEGQKIETPMQLSHGVAYVAVVPPDFFIDAGYENYLMKASRSWEKGQARRNSSTAVSQPDDLKIREDEFSWDSKYHELTNKKDLKDESVKSVVASPVVNLKSDLVKPQFATNKQLNNKPIRGNTVKQPDRRKSSVSQSPAMLKKIGSLPSPPTIRKSSIKRKDSVKINVNTKNETPKCNINLSKSKICKPYIKQDSPADIILSNVEEVVKELRSCSSSKLVGGNTSSLTKNVEAGNYIQSKEIVGGSAVYRNPRSEKPSIALDPHVPLLDNYSIQGQVTELFDVNHQNLENKYEKIQNELNNATSINLPFKFNPFDDFLTDKEVVTSPKTTSNEAYNKTNVFNKEGTVNLKLNIEIWSAHDADNEPGYKKDLQKFKLEKESQVYIEEKPVELVGVCNEIDTKGIDENQNVILVKCACTSQGDGNCTVPINVGNSKFMIILPVLNCEEKSKRCDCKEEKRKNERFSIISNPVKKTVSCMSLLKQEIVSHSEITSRNNSREIKLHDQNDLTMVKHKSVAIREGQTIFPESKAEEPVMLCSSKVIDTPNLAVKDDSIYPPKTESRFTQTELCDMLLEARLEKDGHYSFHVPSLKTLKHYKL